MSFEIREDLAFNTDGSWVACGHQVFNDEAYVAHFASKEDAELFKRAKEMSAYSAKFVEISKDELIAKVREAAKETEFHPIVDEPQVVTGKTTITEIALRARIAELEKQLADEPQVVQKEDQRAHMEHIMNVMARSDGPSWDYSVGKFRGVEHDLGDPGA